MRLLEFLVESERKGVCAEERDTHAWREFGREVAIMVVDSVGFSRTTRAHGIVHFLSKMAAAREIMTLVLGESRATSYGFHADNCIAHFASPDDALETAIALQQAIFKSGLWLNPEELYGISIGVGFGKVLYAESMEGYFGDEMNLASKLGEDVGGRDDILLTESAFSCLSNQQGHAYRRNDISVSGLNIPYFSVTWK